MTKSEFDAKFDECANAFTQFVVSDNRITNRLRELSGAGNTTDDYIAASVALSVELNAAFLRHVLVSVLSLDD